MPQPIVLSHTQAVDLLCARERGYARTTISLDLGLTSSDVALTADGVTFPDAETLSWASIVHIAKVTTQCFHLVGGQAQAIQVFSERTNWLRGLMPTSGAPTMLVSGLAMHRIKGTEPHRDTLTKVATLAPIHGRVLDTATGLGYTAIEVARTASEVVTIELDPAALDVARLNPWSRDLFENPRITQIVGDAAEEVARFADGSFDAILHDPPMFALAGDLYSATFYAQLHRILRGRGRLFHYIGDPQSRSGERVTAGVIRRLGAAGFTRIERRAEAFGVVASR